MTPTLVSSLCIHTDMVTWGVTGALGCLTELGLIGEVSAVISGVADEDLINADVVGTLELILGTLYCLRSRKH